MLPDECGHIVDHTKQVCSNKTMNHNITGWGGWPYWRTVIQFTENKSVNYSLLLQAEVDDHTDEQ